MNAKSKFLIILFLSFAVIFAINTSSVFAQAEKLTIEEYNKQLVKCQERERTANVEIAKLEGEIAELKGKLTDLDNQIAAVQEEIYSMVGPQEQIDAFYEELQDIKNKILGLLRLSLEELYEKLDEVEEIGNKLNDMASDKKAKLPHIAARLKEVQGLYVQLKEKAAQAKPKIETYSVVRGDYLWKIAKKPDIYRDPYSWIRIYSFNREQIKNPDLIYPNQVFKIHKKIEKGQYLIQRGDFLSKISGLSGIYNDPYKWKKIYESNNTVISDPDLIYPNTILFIP